VKELLSSKISDINPLNNCSLIRRRLKAKRGSPISKDDYNSKDGTPFSKNWTFERTMFSF
jgi:hypothetical protein